MIKPAKNLLTIVILLLTASSFGQKSDTLPGKRFDVGINFSPTHCFRMLSFPSEVRDYIDIPRYAYTAGASVRFTIKKRVQLESGVFYAKKGVLTRPHYPLAGTHNGQFDPNLPVQEIYEYNYHYLEFPFKANLYLLTNRFKLYFTGGVSFNVLIHYEHKLTEIYYDGEQKIISPKGVYYSPYSIDYNKVVLATIIGLGSSIELSKRWFIKMEPLFQFSLGATARSSYTNKPTSEHQYSFAFNMGLGYRLSVLK